jgi:hypothetical protein
MTQPYSHQHSFPVYGYPMVIMPYPHRVNASVVSPGSDSNVLIFPRDAISRRPDPVIDGEVLASRTMTVSARPIPVMEPKQSFLRRSLDDPYWILMTLAITLGVSITATALYGLIQITLAIGRWFTTNGTTLATIAALIALLVLCGGTTAAVKCGGIHCGGCQR